MNGAQQAQSNWGEPSFKLVIDLNEALGQLDRDLDDPEFAGMHQHFDHQATLYIAGGLINNVLRLPGSLKIEEALAFFPAHHRARANTILTSFWQSMSADIARCEQMIDEQIRMGQVPRRYEVCFVPAPFISGTSTLTVWYRWIEGAELAEMCRTETMRQYADMDIESVGTF